MKKVSLKEKERIARARLLIAALERMFPKAGMMLHYGNHWELLVAVMLSAQCTDKKVNEVTQKLFKKYKTVNDYASVRQSALEKDIHSTGFYRNKAKNIIAAARLIRDSFHGAIPKTMEDMLLIPGVARKTANVVLGNAYGIVEGIAVDTHVRRFAIKFDLTSYRDPVRIERDLMKIIPKKKWFRFTYLVIEYGRSVCPGRIHDCREHPLSKLYPSAASRFPKSN